MSVDTPHFSGDTNSPEKPSGQLLIEIQETRIAPDHQLIRMVRNASIVEQTDNVDFYYDTPEATLQKQHIWLRRRIKKTLMDTMNSYVDVKAPMSQIDTKGVLTSPMDSLIITNPNATRRFLNIPEMKDPLFPVTTSELLSRGYTNVTSFASKRTKMYLEDYDFFLHIDETEFNYRLLELVKIVDNPMDIVKYRAQMVELFEQFGMETHGTRKILQFQKILSEQKMK